MPDLGGLVAFYGFYNVDVNSERNFWDNKENIAVENAGRMFGNRKDYWIRFP